MSEGFKPSNTIWLTRLQRNYLHVELKEKQDRTPILKVRQFQNEFVKSLFLPKYEQKVVKISALTTLHILKLTDL